MSSLRLALKQSLEDAPSGAVAAEDESSSSSSSEESEELSSEHNNHPPPSSSSHPTSEQQQSHHHQQQQQHIMTTPPPPTTKQPHGAITTATTTATATAPDNKGDDNNNVGGSSSSSSSEENEASLKDLEDSSSSSGSSGSSSSEDGNNDDDDDHHRNNQQQHRAANKIQSHFRKTSSNSSSKKNTARLKRTKKVSKQQQRRRRPTAEADRQHNHDEDNVDNVDNEEDDDDDDDESSTSSSSPTAVTPPDEKLIMYMRTLDVQTCRKYIVPGLRVKAQFDGGLWYGGGVSAVSRDGSKIRIQYDDGTTEIAPFPDIDQTDMIVIDDTDNGNHHLNDPATRDAVQFFAPSTTPTTPAVLADNAHPHQHGHRPPSPVAAVPAPSSSSAAGDHPQQPQKQQQQHRESKEETQEEGKASKLPDIEAAEEQQQHQTPHPQPEDESSEEEGEVPESPVPSSSSSIRVVVSGHQAQEEEVGDNEGNKGDKDNNVGSSSSTVTKELQPPSKAIMMETSELQPDKKKNAEHGAEETTTVDPALETNKPPAPKPQVHREEVVDSQQPPPPLSRQEEEEGDGGVDKSTQPEVMKVPVPPSPAPPSTETATVASAAAADSLKRQRGRPKKHLDAPPIPVVEATRAVEDGKVPSSSKPSLETAAAVMEEAKTTIAASESSEAVRINLAPPSLPPSEAEPAHQVAAASKERQEESVQKTAPGETMTAANADAGAISMDIDDKVTERVRPEESADTIESPEKQTKETKNATTSSAPLLKIRLPTKPLGETSSSKPTLPLSPRTNPTEKVATKSEGVSSPRDNLPLPKKRKKKRKAEDTVSSEHQQEPPPKKLSIRIPVQKIIEAGYASPSIEKKFGSGELPAAQTQGPEEKSVLKQPTSIASVEAKTIAETKVAGLSKEVVATHDNDETAGAEDKEKSTTTKLTAGEAGHLQQREAPEQPVKIRIGSPKSPKSPRQMKKLKKKKQAALAAVTALSEKHPKLQETSKGDVGNQAEIVEAHAKSDPVERPIGPPKAPVETAPEGQPDPSVVSKAAAGSKNQPSEQKVVVGTETTATPTPEAGGKQIVAEDNTPLKDQLEGQVRSERRAAQQANERISSKTDVVSQEQQPQHATTKKKKKRRKDAESHAVGEPVVADDPVPVWVQCNACSKWRNIPGNVVESLPEKWYCKDNIYDPKRSSCDVPEQTAKQVAKEKKRARKRRMMKTAAAAVEAQKVDGKAEEVAPKAKSLERVRSPRPGRDESGKPSKPKRSSPVEDAPTAENESKARKEKKTSTSLGKKGRTAESTEKVVAADSTGEVVKPRGRGRPRRTQPKEPSTTSQPQQTDADNLEWVQCEKCLKWRRLPNHVSADDLPDVWTCDMNDWNTASASCDAPEDKADGLQDIGVFGSSGAGGGKLSYRNLIFGSTGRKANRPVSERTRAAESLFSVQFDEDDAPAKVLYSDSSCFVSRTRSTLPTDENEGLSVLELMSHSQLWQELRGTGHSIEMESGDSLLKQQQLDSFTYDTLPHDVRKSTKDFVLHVIGDTGTYSGDEIVLKAKAMKQESVSDRFKKAHMFCTKNVVVTTLYELVKEGKVDCVQKFGNSWSLKDWHPHYRRARKRPPPPEEETAAAPRPDRKKSRCMKISKPWKRRNLD